MTKECKKDIESIKFLLAWGMPILMTENYEKAKQLVMQLKECRCDLEIKEMSVSFQTKEEADKWVVSQEAKKIAVSIADSPKS